MTPWVDYLLTPVAASIACVLCWRAAARHPGQMRLFWSLLGVATALWTMGEVIWGIYTLILGATVPVPSWADVGYLGAIPFAVAALVAHPATSAGAAQRARWVFDGLVVATALLFFSLTLVLSSVWHSSDLGTWSGIVALAYPFGDVVIVCFVVLAIRGMSGADRLSMWCLLGALLAMALSDSTALTYLAAADWTSPGLIDTGWVAAYLGIALAAFSSQPSSGVPGTTAEHDGAPLQALLTPMLPVLLALGVVALETSLGHHLDHAAWLMALALVVLVLGRQALHLIELLASRRDTHSGLIDSLSRIVLGGAPAENRDPPSRPA